LAVGAVALMIFAQPARAAPDKAPAGAERTAPWNAETSDLEPDSSIIYGRLPNGLRYAIRPNDRPQNQVLVRLALDVGSAAETDDEQGLAHFIEHMAFNGSTHVPEGEMVKTLERLGLSFGAAAKG
jgi:zinc protease